MEKYTDLEQALRDASLAIITDDISTQKELNRIYLRYKLLPKRQKRFSDYYSVRFLGHNVTEMYFLKKDELRGPEDVLAEWKQLNRKYMVSEPDLYYREESFNSGDTNICFILGHSGSGKSVMARMLEGDDIDHIELDDLLLIRDHFTMDELRNYSDMVWNFFAGEGSKYYIGVEERNRIPREEYEDRIFTDFVTFAMAYAKQHREKKYIIEGIWIYLYFEDPSVFKDYAVFIKGTSFLKSKIRAMKREMQRDKESLKQRKEMFGREVRNYLLDEDKIDSFRRFFADRPDTILREETGDANALDAIIGENDDADGIKKIMKTEEKRMWAARFSALATANVADAMDNLGIAVRNPQGVYPLEAGQPRTAGFAVTMEQKPRRVPFDGKNLARQALVVDENLEDGDLLVISAADVRVCCTAGGLQAMRMKMEGVRGLLTDGSLRDVDEMAEMGFPVYLSGTSPLKSTRYIETTGINVPVKVGGADIFPGDLVLMDRSGVLIIAPENLEAVAAEAERITEVEDRIMENIRGGMSFAEAKSAAER